ncbi:hypothetical protein ACLB2K_067618 [Fragaria x ananassa]
MDGELQLKDLKLEPVVEGRAYSAHPGALRTRKFNGEIAGEITGWGRARNPHPKLRELRHPSSDIPALHFAVMEANSTIVDELVRIMTEDDLEEILDPSGRTAICCAIENPFAVTLETVKLMIEKNKK